MPEKSRLLTAMDLCWAAAYMGASRLPDLHDRSYTESVTSNPAAACTRCFFIFDEGLGYASGDVACPSIFILPKPKNGYSELLAEPEQYAELFGALAKPKVLAILHFMAQRPSLPFSCERLVQTLGEKSEKERKLIEDVFQSLVALGYLTEEKVDLDSRVTTIYRPETDLPLYGLISFASEALRRTRLWVFQPRGERKAAVIRKISPIAGRTDGVS